MNCGPFLLFTMIMGILSFFVGLLLLVSGGTASGWFTIVCSVALFGICAYIWIRKR